MFNLVLTLSVYSVVFIAALLILVLIIRERESWAVYHPLDPEAPSLGCLIHRDEEADLYCILLKPLGRHCG